MERQRKRTAGVTSQETRTLWLPDPSFLAAAHRPAKHAFCGGGEDVSFAYSSMDSWIFIFYTPSYNLIHLDFIAQIVPALVIWVPFQLAPVSLWYASISVVFILFLSLSDTTGYSTCPVLVLGSVISRRCPCYFYWRVILETKICCLEYNCFYSLGKFPE